MAAIARAPRHRRRGGARGRRGAFGRHADYRAALARARRDALTRTQSHHRSPIRRTLALEEATAHLRVLARPLAYGYCLAT